MYTSRAIAQMRQAVQFNSRRSFQSTAARLSGHVEEGPYNNLPFKVGNKFTFAIKITLFAVTGYGIPIAACYYQL